METPVFVAAEPVFHQQVTSTNDVARKAYAASGEVGVLHVAEEQLRGRGRYGRTWASPPGLGFYGSVLITDEAVLREAGMLPFATAIAVGDALRALVPCETRYKWPNDIYLNGGKVAGVLVEGEMQGSRRVAAVLGMGVNLHHGPEALPASTPFPATSVRLECGDAPAIAAFAASLPEHLNRVLFWLASGRRDLLWKAYRERWYDRGRRVRVQNALESVIGTLEDIDADGQLLVRTEAGVTRFLSGSLRYADGHQVPAEKGRVTLPKQPDEGD